MNENEARLVYKNKITKNINLALFIASCVLIFFTTFFAALLLIMDGEVGLSAQVFDYIYLVLTILALVFLAVRMGLMFVDGKDGLSRARYHAIDIVKLLISGALILAHLDLGLGAFFGNIANANHGLNLFLRGYSIFIFVLEVIIFVYGLWRIAWIKENPERIYGTLAVSKVDSSRTPVRTSYKTSSKTYAKSPEPVKIEAAPKAIGVVDAEVKEIEVKK